MKLIQKHSTSSGILAGKPASNAGQFTRWADDHDHGDDDRVSDDHDHVGDDHDRVGDDHDRGGDDHDCGGGDDDAQFSSGDQMLIAINF